VSEIRARLAYRVSAVIWWGLLGCWPAVHNRSNGLTKNARHEIEEQEMYCLQIDFITTQCAIFLKQLQNTRYSSKITCILLSNNLNAHLIIKTQL